MDRLDKINFDLMDAWADALESGDYEQGQNVLRQRNAEGVDNWCCLGVLLKVADEMDLAAGEWVEPTDGTTTSVGWVSGIDRHILYGIAPSSVMDKAGIGTHTWLAVSADYTSMNDNERKTFSEIAQFVRLQKKKAQELIARKANTDERK